MTDHRRTSRNEIVQPHWTERAERVGPARLANSPLVGLVGESGDGDLHLPSWRNDHRDSFPGGWWGRPLDLRRPTHWLPYLRSRLARKLVFLDAY